MGRKTVLSIWDHSDSQYIMWTLNLFIYLWLFTEIYTYLLTYLGVPSKKKTVYLQTLSKLMVTPLPPTLFLTNLFLTKCWPCWPPPSPGNFDKNHEILGFEIYIVYYPYYFLRVRGTDRKTQRQQSYTILGNYTRLF